MGRLSKSLKKYERHFLLGLVVILLLTFSVGGALSCQDGRGGGATDYSGDYLITPTKREALDSNEVVSWRNRLDPYRWTVRVPSLRYGVFLRQADPDPNGFRALWSHALTAEAARAAGYEVGEEYQLKAAVRKAVEGVMRGMAFNDATYDRFIREYYRRPAKEFEQTIRELVAKDAFVRPIVETNRFRISYEQAYETWKRILERVDLEYVALRGEDFNLRALEQETTRERIGAQVDLLNQVSKTARDLSNLVTKVTGWQDAHDGAAPATLQELSDAVRKDAWGAEVRYAPADDSRAFDLRSAGPDGAFDSSDDVTLDTVAQLKTRAALREVGAALLRWHEATDAWPETIEAMREAPGEGHLAPLVGSPTDAWDAALVYALPQADGLPTLSSQGPDGEPGTDDDVEAVVTVGDVHVPAGPAFVAYLLDQDQDAWKRPLRIDLAHALSWQWRVSSAGKDGVFGSDDDLDTGNQAELEGFYAQPDIKIAYEVPERREFEAVYVHLPFVSDETLAWLLETYPQHDPRKKTPAEGEDAAYDRWRQLHGYGYYMAEDPADPEEGHGVEHARTVAPDSAPTLVPASTVFGEPPEGFIGEDDPDKKVYVEKGWRPIVLRESFLESLMMDLLTRARESRDALKAWEEKKAAFDAAGGEGEDPGEAPVEITFQTLLDTELKDFLPKEGQAPWIALYRTEKPLERIEIEELPNIGELGLSQTLQQLDDAGQYAPIPNVLNDSHTKAIVRLLEHHPRHDRPLDEVRGEIFAQFVEGKRLDLAAQKLAELKAAVEKAAATPEGVESPADVWKQTFDTWKATLDAPVVVEQTGTFVGSRPPSTQEIGDDVEDDDAARIKRRDYVRTTGYDTLRAGLDIQDELTPGTIGKTVLRDDLAEGSDTVFLVRLTDVGYPPPQAFSPRDYADYLSVEILGGSKGGRKIGAAGAGGRVVGNFWETLSNFFYDPQRPMLAFDWLKKKFDLQSAFDPEATREP